MVDYNEKCPHVDKQQNGPWCKLMRWRLLKGVTKNPCAKCPHNPENKV